MLTSSTLSGTILKLNSFDEKHIYWDGSYDLSIKDIIGTNCSIIKYTTNEINGKISCSFLIKDLNKIRVVNERNYHISKFRTKFSKRCFSFDLQECRNHFRQIHFEIFLCFLKNLINFVT